MMRRANARGYWPIAVQELRNKANSLPKRVVGCSENSFPIVGYPAPRGVRGIPKEAAPGRAARSRRPPSLQLSAIFRPRGGARVTALARFVRAIRGKFAQRSWDSGVLSQPSLHPTQPKIAFDLGFVGTKSRSRVEYSIFKDRWAAPRSPQTSLRMTGKAWVWVLICGGTKGVAGGGSSKSVRSTVECAHFHLAAAKEYPDRRSAC